MKHFLTTLVLILCIGGMAHAQSNQSGKVSVKQSAEIDELVYGKKKDVPKTKEQLKAEKKAAKKAEKEAKKQAKKEAALLKAAGKKGTPTPQQTQEPVKQEPVQQKVTEVKATPKVEVKEPVVEELPRTKLVRRRVKVDPSRRAPKSVVYNGMRKTSGYRVQVVSGGNTREDKHRAEQAGHKVKAKFPGQPVYVHFHSPRWYCRVGNFTDYKKAEALKNQIRSMGFPQATVIKTTIVVRNVARYY